MPRPHSSAARLSAVVLLLFAAAAAADDDPPPARESPLPPSLLTTLDALGASSGVPDGAGVYAAPARSVRGQSARMGLSQYQLGATGPVAEGLFATASARTLAVRTDALLPDDRVRFPAAFSEVLVGGTYIRQRDGGSSWGVGLTFGSASDRLFHSRRELVANALGFVRLPAGEKEAWLFYAVSATNGQVGRNVPVPGVAYEFDRGDWSGIVGFPFISVAYRPVERVKWEFFYAPLTDVQTKLTYTPADTLTLSAGFEWTNQSWFRAGRSDPRQLLFWYEKRVGAGVSWGFAKAWTLDVGGGWAFDRYFVENDGFSLGGRNTVRVGGGPYLLAQVGMKY